MTSLELVAYGTLWTMLVLLGLLVLVLYRQVEKIYAAPRPSGGGIDLGSDTPDLEVVNRTGVSLYNFPATGPRILAVFVSTSCDACRTLLSTLRNSFSEENIVVLSSGEWSDEFSRSLDGLSFQDLAHPYDAARAYGLSTYPTTFLIRDRKVLARTTKDSVAAIQDLLRTPESADQPDDLDTGAADPSRDVVRERMNPAGPVE